MPKTYEPIATTTLGSAQASVTFNSGLSGYTDLRLIVQTKQTGSSDYSRIQFDSSNTYSQVGIYGSGTSAVSPPNGTNQPGIYPLYYYSESSTNWTIAQIDIMNYANTNINKTVLYRAGDAGQVVQAGVGMWRNTAAITAVTYSTVGTFTAGSTFTLYGIKAA